MALKRFSKRYVSLLEVLIALSIIALCIFPLIAPHVAIFKDQASFTNQIDLDHRISLMYADIYQKLQENQIPFSAIEQKQSFPVDLTQSESNPLPYKGEYRFIIEKMKPPPPAQPSGYLVDLVFTFNHVNDLNKTQYGNSEIKIPKYEVVYKIFLARNPGGASATAAQKGGTNASAPPQK